MDEARRNRKLFGIAHVAVRLTAGRVMDGLVSGGVRGSAGVTHHLGVSFKGWKFQGKCN